MSITRLQQARQMYAMGQRVGRIAFGGGGSYVSGPGAGKYQGGSGAPGSAESKAMGGSGSTYSSPSDHGGTGNDPGGYVSKTNPTGTLTGKDYQEAEEKYLTGVGQSQLENLYKTGVPTINAPFNLPSAVTLGLNVLKPVRNFTLRKNIDYFKGLDQTKYPQTLQGYKDYMKNRLAGYTDAAGNTHPNYYMDSQGNYISRDGGGGGEGIMDVVVDDTTTDDDTTTNDFFSRYLQNQPDDIREEIEARMQNYYTV